jgi:uncharacterized coiled-coil DUF342 family protein
MFNSLINVLESMQAPLPEDVERLVNRLNNDAADETTELEAADMLERLWRENAALMDENVWLQKAQARIEELENWYNTPGLETTRTNIKLLKRIEELEETLSKTQNRNIEAERLEAVLEKIEKEFPPPHMAGVYARKARAGK